MKRPTTIKEYISSAPKEAQSMLKEIHAILKAVAPKANEGIKWGYPVWEEKRILFSVAAHRAHLNFMPTESTLKQFKDDLADFKTGKDTIQLPYDKPLPKALIKKIASYRAKDVRENDEKWMKNQ